MGRKFCLSSFVIVLIGACCLGYFFVAANLIDKDEIIVIDDSGSTVARAVKAFGAGDKLVEYQTYQQAAEHLQSQRVPSERLTVFCYENGEFAAWTMTVSELSQLEKQCDRGVFFVSEYR